MSTTRTPSDQPSRRRLLGQSIACTLLAPAVKLRAAQTRSRETHRTLVLLHLSGGNDGLNTIIPYADPIYRRLRPRLGHVAADAVPINHELGFHPALAPLKRLYDAGQIAVIQGVGCQNPDYSHVGSCARWAGGVELPECGGWGDRLVEGTASDPRGPAVAIGVRPLAAMIRPAQLKLAGSSSAAVQQPLGYVPRAIERSLATAARAASLPQPPALVLATVGGFDTHADQARQHARLLGELAEVLVRFQNEITRRGRSRQVLLIAWSEFGRRIAENSQGGTDHGSAGPVLLLGGGIRGGLYGRTPSLEVTDFGNLIASVDLAAIRQLAAAWLGGPNPTAVRNLAAAMEQAEARGLFPVC